MLFCINVLKKHFYLYRQVKRCRGKVTTHVAIFVLNFKCTSVIFIGLNDQVDCCVLLNDKLFTGIRQSFFMLDFSILLKQRLLNVSANSFCSGNSFLFYMIRFTKDSLKLLSANPTKCSNTLKQFVGFSVSGIFGSLVLERIRVYSI